MSEETKEKRKERFLRKNVVNKGLNQPIVRPGDTPSTKPRNPQAQEKAIEATSDGIDEVTKIPRQYLKE